MAEPASAKTGARALCARGALVGALGGLLAGAVDFALAAERARTFLPTGRASLGLFLCALYGAAAAGAAAAVGLIAAALGRASDLGPLWREAFEGGEPEQASQPSRGRTPAEGARWAAYAAAAAAAAAGLGLGVRQLAVVALARFHHRVLIAALVGAEAVALAVTAAPLVLLGATALSAFLRWGPRARLKLVAPAGLYAFAWGAGLVAGAGGVAACLYSLEQRARMPPALKALNTGLWAPIIVAGALGAAHLLARLVARRLGAGVAAGGRPGWARALSRVDGAALAALAALGLPLAIGAATYWPVVGQLDLRPFAAVTVGAAAALAAALGGVGRGIGSWPPARRAALALLLPALFLGTALRVGRSDRVRKAAVAYTGLTGPLVMALHAATDLDRDGFSSVLGGGDCDDLDRDVHPGALDWPDDGIDQDCNGHQATLDTGEVRQYAAVPPSVPRDLNVVLLTIDALRADHVGSYGYRRPTTPNLDALASEGVRFANGWAHAPSTRYSVPAILTGRYPSTIPVGNAWWPPNLLPENRLWAEILRERGYHTGAFLPYYYFNRSWGLDQGFDEYDISLEKLHSMGGDPAATHGTSARPLADLDIAYLERHKDEKFFLWSHFYDTHFQFERHPDAPETDFGADEKSLYDGEIRYTDIHVGRVLDALRRLGLWDKTIVIITADHGDGFGEHGIPPNQRHGYHLYATETKVPFIIRVPGLPPRVVDPPVGHIDLLPTVLNLLGAAPDAEPQLLGQSLLGLMLGESATNRHVFQEVWYEGPTSRKAVVTSNWHLIRNLVPDDTTELYDLAGDAAEEHDRAGDGETAEHELGGLLASWMDQAALPRDFRKRVEGNVSKAPLPFGAPLGDRLGDWIVLEGADVVTPTVSSGGAAEVALILHGVGRVPEGWRLFTHFVGPGGRRINADHDPVDGLVPLGRVQNGVWLRDRVRVTLPPGWPPGPISVEVGLWRRGERAPALGPHSAGDAVRAATLTVAP
jgi:arylsulfatase A-like enzyme